jgi:hypothetical protein
MVSGETTFHVGLRLTFPNFHIGGDSTAASGVCDHPGTRAELVVITVLNHIQVPFNPDSVYALHFVVVYFSHCDTSHRTNEGSPSDFDFSELNSEVRPHDRS